MNALFQLTGNVGQAAVRQSGQFLCAALEMFGFVYKAASISQPGSASGKFVAKEWGDYLVQQVKQKSFDLKKVAREG